MRRRRLAMVLGLVLVGAAVRMVVGCSAGCPDNVLTPDADCPTKQFRISTMGPLNGMWSDCPFTSDAYGAVVWIPGGGSGTCSIKAQRGKTTIALRVRFTLGAYGTCTHCYDYEIDPPYLSIDDVLPQDSGPGSDVTADVGADGGGDAEVDADDAGAGG